MQFFPAMAPGFGPSSQAFSRFDFMDARAGQDFSGLLSEQMQQPDPQDMTSRPIESEPVSGPEPAATEYRTQDAAPAAAVVDEGAPQREEAPASHERHAESDARSEAGRADDPAKAAENVHDAPRKEEGKAAKTGEGDSESTSSGVSDGAAPQDAGSPDTEALQEELDAVEQEAKGRAAVNPDVDARIKALRELLGTLHQADPAERSELAVTLGAQIKALREELVAPGAKAERADHALSRAAAEGAEKSALHSQARAVRKGRDGEASVHAAAAGRNAGGSVKAAHASVAPDAGTDMALAGKGRVQASTDSVHEATKEVTSAQNEPKAAAGASVAEGSAGAAGLADGARADGKAQAEDVLGRAGTKAHAADTGAAQTPSEAVDENRAAGNKPTATAQETALKASVDSAPREAGKSHGAVQAAELVGRGEAARDHGVAADASRADATDARNVAPAQANGAKGDQARQDARQGFFGARGEEQPRQAKPVASASGKIVHEAEAQALGTGQNTQSAALQRGESPVSSRSAEVYRQVETGAFRNLGQGVKQLVIRLDPEELGQVSVILQVKGKEVQAVLRASSQETSQALGEQLSQLRTQLESQGLKVGKLEVQTQLADSQGQSQWQGAEQHNRYQENRELALSGQRWRTLERVDSGLVREVQSGVQRENLSQRGLDIFA